MDLLPSRDYITNIFFCLSVYLSYLFFQLFSHKGLYQDDNEEILESKRYSENPFKFKRFRRGKRPVPQYTDTAVVGSPRQQVHSLPGDAIAEPTTDPEAGHEEEAESPQMTVAVSVGLLVAVTVVS